MSNDNPLSSISLKQLAALFVSDAMTEENFRQLASKFFPPTARPSTSGKSSISHYRPSFDSGNLMNDSSVASGSAPVTGMKGHLAAFSSGTASPQLRQMPMSDRDRYLFSMDLQSMFVLLRVPNLRESDAIRALSCLNPLSVHRCIEQLRRCRSTSETLQQSRLVAPTTPRPSNSTDAKYNSPVWKPATSRLVTTPKHNEPEPRAIHVVSRKGVEQSAVFLARSGNETKRNSSGQHRPLSAPASRVWKSSSKGAPPQKSAHLTERSYALTHRDQVARDVVGAISWLGDVAIDTTSPALPAQRKSLKDFRVAHASLQKHLPTEVGSNNGYLENSAKKSGLLLQQMNTTSVVIKALQHGRPKVSHAERMQHRDHEASRQPIRKCSADGSSTDSKWIQSNMRFNMHERRRHLLQQVS
jgi:hypothetical protein